MRFARHEDPGYVAKVIREQLFSYFSPDCFRGKRVLDFGCGNGASTMIIGQLLPETEVIGVELDATNVDEARAILAHRCLTNVQFLQSPSPNALPDGIGMFDFVMLSAVFEHLLPAERQELMPLIWSHMRVGAAIFVNQTPHRWQPYEHHSSGLWFINYLPDRAAWWVAARWGRGTRGRSWESMLRGGIRGATERSVWEALTRGRLFDAEVLQPHELGLKDRADYWLRCLSARGYMIKRVVAKLFRLSDRLFGTLPSLNLDVVIRRVR